MDKNELFPKAKKGIENFLTDQEGNIPRNKILTVGVMTILLGIIFAQDAFAAHRSHSSHRSHQSHRSHSNSGHRSHYSHSSSSHGSSHNSHSNVTTQHNSHSSHSNVTTQHNSHSSHSSHSDHNSHVSHANSSGSHSSHVSSAGYTAPIERSIDLSDLPTEPAVPKTSEIKLPGSPAATPNVVIPSEEAAMDINVGSVPEIGANN